MKEIICEIGVVGSGKDFRATELENKKDYYHINFADAVRESAWICLGYRPQNVVEYEKFKVATIECKELNFSLTGREFLIKIGNDVGRNYFREDFWIELAKDKIEKHLYKPGACNSDTRYLNEVKAMLDVGKKHNIDVKFKFCNYKSERYDNTIFSESEFMAQILTKMSIEDKADITEIVTNWIDNPPNYHSLLVKINNVKTTFIFNYNDVFEQKSCLAFIDEMKSYNELEELKEMYFEKNGNITIKDLLK